MSQFTQAIQAHLEKHNLSFNICEGKVRPYFALNYTVNNLRMEVILDQDEPNGLVFAYFVSPALIPKERRAEALALMNWLNWRLITVGNFEMDPRDGELRVRVAMDIDGSELTDQMVFNIIAGGIHLMDQHFPKFMEVCFGHATAEDVIQRITGELKEEDEEAQTHTDSSPARVH